MLDHEGSREDIMALADWRRRVAELYAAVRVAPDPATAWRLWRAEREWLIRCHPQSPLLEPQRVAFDGLPFFAYDPALRFTPDLTDPEDTNPLTIDVGPDGRMTLMPFGRTAGLAAALGGELTLFWIAGYGGGVFLPFADTHPATYGGGRYLLDWIKGADLGSDHDGRPILDFNFAYNPSCAYNTYDAVSRAWVCPLAPTQNHLPRSVPAGEKAPTDI